MSVARDPLGERPAILGAADRALLLGIARRAIGAAVGIRDASDGPAAVAGSATAIAGSATLAAPGRAFVTLTEHGELRGCIGSLAADVPLADAVGASAANAAVRDPRFRPVRRAELPNLRLGISVLGEITPLGDIDNFEPGVHGILVIGAGRRGLLLPEVATEMGWNAVEMLTAVCTKAGLPRSAWRHPGTALLAFRTERFGGPVVPDPAEASELDSAEAAATAAGDGPPPADSSATPAG